MGQVLSCCSTNIFKELYEQYGEEFAKLMVAEKLKGVIGEEFASLIGKFGGVFKEFEQKASGTVQGGRKEIEKMYS